MTKKNDLVLGGISFGPRSSLSEPNIRGIVHHHRS